MPYYGSPTRRYELERLYKGKKPPFPMSVKLKAGQDWRKLLHFTPWDEDVLSSESEIPQEPRDSLESSGQQASEEASGPSGAKRARTN